MTRRKPTPEAEQPHLAPLKIEGQPWHPDPEVMAKLSELDATDPLPTTNATMTAAEAEQVAVRAWAESSGWVTDPLPQPENGDYDPTFDADALMTTSETRHRFVWTEVPSTEHWSYDNRPNTTAEDSPATNPYLLESSKILSDLAAEAHRAQLTIDALDHEIEHLTADADFQIRRIEARRDAEISQRTARVDDLMKIVSANTIVNGGKDQTNDPQ